MDNPETLATLGTQDTRPNERKQKSQHNMCNICLGELRNKSWKPECVGSFNMDWRILVFYPEPGARDTIY